MCLFLGEKAKYKERHLMIFLGMVYDLFLVSLLEYQPYWLQTETRILL